MLSLKVFYKKYFKIPETYTTVVEKKNIYFLRILFIIALFFGTFFSIFFSIDLFVFKNPVRIDLFVYYLNYLLIGGLGLLFIHLKFPCKFILAYSLLCLDIVFVFVLYETSIANCLVCFLGLSFTFVMLLEVNPHIFSLFFLQALILIGVFKKLNFFSKNHSRYTDSVFFLNVVLLFIVLIFLVFWKRRKVVEEFNRQVRLSVEQNKTETLLRNILPNNVIEEIKDVGASSAVKYPNVSVFHSDIIDFTKTTSTMEPEFVISELNDIFTAFDEITEKFGCMRVKTIGDAYVAVCGLPEPDENHAKKMIQCAQAIIEYLKKRNETSEIHWNIRCGIATGDVIAGVIGLQKYIYDIFGPTADKALKVQEKSNPMEITVCEETYKLIKEKIKVSENSGCYVIEGESDAE